MRILIVGGCDALNLMRFHEALKDGLRAVCDARVYGQGYPGFDPAVTDATDIARRVFPDGPPDLVLANYYLTPDPKDLRFECTGMADLRLPKAVILSDFWLVTDQGGHGYADWIERHGVDLVLCQYPAAVQALAGTRIADRCRWLPICIDPRMMNDWQPRRAFDVGFLGRGVQEHDPFYPERYRIHRLLSGSRDLRYYSAPHPGYGDRSEGTPLVGADFARAIGACRMHVVTGGVHRNPFGKVFETLAARTVLVGPEPKGAAALGLVDGVNCLFAEEDGLLEKVRWHLQRPELCERIATEGHRLAMRRHTCFARAADLIDLWREWDSRRDARQPVAAVAAVPSGTSRPGSAPPDRPLEWAESWTRRQWAELAATLGAGADLSSYGRYLLGQCRAKLGDSAGARAAFAAELACGSGPVDPADLSPYGSLAELAAWARLPGSFHRHLPILHQFAVAMDAQAVLEIGVGASTRALRLAMRETCGHLTSIDADVARFAQVAASHGDASWSLRIGACSAVVQTLAGPFDLVLHDGAHDRATVEADLAAILPRVRTFGLILVHDTQQPEFHDDMLPAVRAATRGWPVSLTTLPWACGLTIIRVERSVHPARVAGGVLRDGMSPDTAPRPHRLRWSGVMETSPALGRVRDRIDGAAHFLRRVVRKLRRLAGAAATRRA